MDGISDFVTAIWTEIRLGTGIRFHPSRRIFNQSQDYPTLIESYGGGIVFIACTEVRI
jgi:hypothetical protein